MRKTALLSIILVLSLVACRDERPEGFLEGAQKSETDSAAHPASVGGSELTPTVSTGATVLVSLEDNRIAIANPDQIPPGPTILTVKNVGGQVHGLIIEGNGVSRTTDQATIPTGGSVDIDVKLEPGTYTLYCPVQDHRTTNREETTLIVKPADAPAPTSTAV